MEKGQSDIGGSRKLTDEGYPWLDPGASAEEIARAHRTRIPSKRSTYLAAQID
jgi:hypothetical protein